MTPDEVQRMRNVITAVLDRLMTRIAETHAAPAPIRDATLDLVVSLRAAERRADALIVELRRAE